ncbi:hypothetical protein ABTK18_19240, partial [Acinetobacter baumannii]
QTAYAIVNNVLPELSDQQIADLFTHNARKIFNLSSSIKEGATANITLFSRKGSTELTQESNKSKSSNSPFFHLPLKGKVIGIINKGSLFLNK